MSFYNNINNIPLLLSCKEVHLGDIYKYYPIGNRERQEPCFVQVTKSFNRNNPCRFCCFKYGYTCKICEEVGIHCHNIINTESFDMHFEKLSL